MISVIVEVGNDHVEVGRIDRQFDRRFDERCKRRLRLGRDRSELDAIEEYRLEIDGRQIGVAELHRFQRGELLRRILARPVVR